ncbi:LytTR family DNA-binding domain-containing protein [Allosphingosinicella indica]|uniref:LytTr DNA-binding domain-containing protein n=1 Tax=Allosphingosinicella indica TaxID=941907 RepID=A0A1X7FYN9_9SPHN|nr:LytTR family DNA-binding domain-containing protein [Allosphingosinicella indica]SMF61254.1 LytTr DNA-binding domain-containing protein [Allosphingosinicella indica]
MGGEECATTQPTISPDTSALIRASLGVFVACTLAAFLFAAQNWVVGGPYGSLVWPRNLTIALVQWWAWALLAPAILLFVARRSLLPLSPVTIALYVALFVATLALHLLIVTLAERTLDRVTPGEPLRLTASNLLRKRWAIDFAILAGLVALGHALAFRALWQRQSAATETAIAASPPGRIAVQKGDRTILVETGRIDWVEAAGNYAILHSGGEEYMLRATLGRLETGLAPQLVRASRSALVAPHAVAATRNPTRNGDLTLVLKSGREVKLTRKHRRALIERLPAAL